MSGGHGHFAWYELLTTDMAAAAAFYRHVAGWRAQDAAAAFPYAIFDVAGAQVGGLMELPPEGRRMGATPRWVGYVAVDDIGDTVARLTGLGGSVLVPPTDSNIGRVSIVADPQTATFGLVGGLKHGGAPFEADRPGQIGWRELYATDGKQALAFYSALFGWQPEASENDPLDTYQLVALGGRPIGGMFNKLPRAPVPFWLYYIEVPDIAVAAARVTEAGGRVVQGPMEIMGGSWIARCLDPQGAMFSLQGEAGRQVSEPASVREMDWAAEWGAFASRGKVVAKPKSEKPGTNKSASPKRKLT